MWLGGNNRDSITAITAISTTCGTMAKWLEQQAHDQRYTLGLGSYPTPACTREFDSLLEKL